MINNRVSHAYGFADLRGNNSLVLKWMFMVTCLLASQIAIGYIKLHRKWLKINIVTKLRYLYFTNLNGSNGSLQPSLLTCKN